jgi:imidazolonepropionase-like amidohydrolase
LQHDRVSLAVGKRADIALFDVGGYNELLYRMGSNLLNLVFVGGQQFTRQDLVNSLA